MRTLTLPRGQERRCLRQGWCRLLPVVQRRTERRTGFDRRARTDPINTFDEGMARWLANRAPI